MKWEYTISFLTSFKHRNGELEKHLNEMGQAGWEMVAVDNGMVYFKRVLEVEVSLEGGFKFAEGISPDLVEAVIEEITDTMCKAVRRLAKRKASG